MVGSVKSGSGRGRATRGWGVAGIGEDGGFGVVEVVVADGVADGFGGTLELMGDVAGNFFDAQAIMGGEEAGEVDDFAFFLVGDLFEVGGAVDAVFVGGGELGDGGIEEAQAAAAVGIDIAEGDEALLRAAAWMVLSEHGEFAGGHHRGA